MAQQTIKTTFKFRRGNADTFEANNPVLSAGEPAYELDEKRLKIGDGVTAWSDLPYIVGGDDIANLEERISNIENLGVKIDRDKIVQKLLDSEEEFIMCFMSEDESVGLMADKGLGPSCIAFMLQVNQNVYYSFFPLEEGFKEYMEALSNSEVSDEQYTTIINNFVLVDLESSNLDYTNIITDQDLAFIIKQFDNIVYMDPFVKEDFESNSSTKELIQNMATKNEIKSINQKVNYINNKIYNDNTFIPSDELISQILREALLSSSNAQFKLIVIAEDSNGTQLSAMVNPSPNTALAFVVMTQNENEAPLFVYIFNSDFNLYAPGNKMYPLYTVLNEDLEKTDLSFYDIVAPFINYFKPGFSEKDFLPQNNYMQLQINQIRDTFNSLIDVDEEVF